MDVLIPYPRTFALFVALLAAGLGALALAGGERAGNPLLGAELAAATAAAPPVAAAAANPPASEPPVSHERPPRPRHLDVATPAQEAQAAKAQAAKLGPRPGQVSTAPQAVAPAAGDPSRPTILPPASAGTNGSYKPPPAYQREETTPHLMADLKNQEQEGQAILINGIALAPPNAPKAVKAAISAANEIVNRPYVWGGGHASWYSAGYDCSGAVSYALGGAGLLSAPLASTALESWGEAGPGNWITVYANAGHAYAEIAGLRWDTVGDAAGSGPRWHLEPAYPQGFVERHPPGY
jgi:cell wall-associated NlpC family hydrolase